ncbi:MAG: hypothetical protein A3E78_03190 [Alphaproteobacteria bacterium RIFCSPHIGHO2_12_FULL_63_12]|nr:MAG: hypothetical protein A3E78_03190 [Alphaproteobacteria bacterium RIFCSPHIGHO2_12_FULL_63_12]
MRPRLNDEGRLHSAHNKSLAGKAKLPRGGCIGNRAFLLHMRERRRADEIRHTARYIPNRAKTGVKIHFSGATESARPSV